MNCSFENMINLILPPRCPFTGESVDFQGGVSPQAWAGLTFISAPLCHGCGFPFEFALPQGAEEALCASCLASRPPYNAARAALVYNDASRDLILKFKHGDQMQAAVCMMPWLKSAGAEFWERTDLIVPVPLHRWRLLRRRYNQAAIMGQCLARQVDVPCAVDALVRRRATVTQGHLRSKERAKNVRAAFEVPQKRKPLIAGKRIVLIDDVYTTGATVRECTKALLAAGAVEVNVLCLARVVRSGRLEGLAE